MDMFITTQQKYETTDRSTLLQWFETNEETDDFFEFMCNSSQQFVVLVIDIILDPSANSEQDTALSTTLFHEFRASPQLWLNLPSWLQEQTKRKLLQGILDTEGSNKVDILAHMIVRVASFGSWHELIPFLLDLNTENHSIPVLKAIYSEISHIVKDEPIAHESTCSLFHVMNAVINNIEDETLLVNVMRITMVFLIHSYVTNHKELNLIDDDLNINANHSVFNQMDLDIEESYDAADICFSVLVKVSASYFGPLCHVLIFISNVFLRINEQKIRVHQISFNAWNFATLSESIFNIFYQIIEQRASTDYFKEYFKTTNGDDLFANMISVTYSHETEPSHLLHQFAEHYALYMWNKVELLVPFLQKRHPVAAIEDVKKIKEKLYHQEWVAVCCFVRHHYSPLYDQLHIPIMDMVFRYLSLYLSINIIVKDANVTAIINKEERKQLWQSLDRYCVALLEETRANGYPPTHPFIHSESTISMFLKLGLRPPNYPRGLRRFYDNFGSRPRFPRQPDVYELNACWEDHDQTNFEVL
eukprot:57000_1